jgi:hypothetical protein
VTPVGLPFATTQDVSGATPDTTDPAPCYGNTTGSVWYSFASSANLVVEVDTAGSNFATQLSVVKPMGSSFSYVTCAAESGGPKRAQLTLDALAGTTYLIKVTRADASACPAGGCQLSMKISQARQHQVELRLKDTSTKVCGAYASISTSRPLASDYQSKSSANGDVKVTAVGVGTDFDLYAYGDAYPCGAATIGPLKGSLFVDGIRVGKLKNLLVGSYRYISFDSYELEDGSSPQVSPPSDPDIPTGTRVASMQTKSVPDCDVYAEVSIGRSSPQGTDYWNAERGSIGMARIATVANTGDSASMSFGGYGCSDGSKVKGAPRIDGVAVGSGWLSLRSGSAGISGTIAPAAP